MKKDLNLVPKTEGASGASKFLLPVILLVVLYAATAYLAISIPAQRLQAREDESANLQQKITELEYVEVEYQAIRAQLQEIEAKKQTIRLTTSTERASTYVFELIEEACPVDILLTHVVMAEDGVVITGKTSSDVLIAEFDVNLRALPIFQLTNISSIEPQDVSYDVIQQAIIDGVDTPKVRVFTLSLAYTDILEYDTEEGEG